MIDLLKPHWLLEVLDLNAGTLAAFDPEVSKQSVSIELSLKCKLELPLSSMLMCENLLENLLLGDFCIFLTLSWISVSNFFSSSI